MKFGEVGLVGLEVRKMRDEEDMMGIVRKVGGSSALKDDEMVFS